VQDGVAIGRHGDFYGGLGKVNVLITFGDGFEADGSSDLCG
jgi:hypothetical protein